MNSGPHVLAPDSRTGTVESIAVEFKTYLDSSHAPKLIWTVGSAKGNDAVLDARESVVILPQGRTVTLPGIDGRYLSIPRYLSTALYNDIEALAAQYGKESTSDDDESSVTSMFD